MADRLFKGVRVASGTKMSEYLEKGDTKSAEKLLKALTQMAEGNYELPVVQRVHKDFSGVL